MHSLCARIVTYLITKIRVCLSFYRHSTRAHALLYGIVKKKKSTQGPALKLEPTPLQATASLRPLLVSFRLVFLIDPPSQKLFIACNQHIFVNRQEITFIAISYD